MPSNPLSRDVASDTPETFLLRDERGPFRCECGANVFRALHRPHAYECNACGVWYEGDALAAQSPPLLPVARDEDSWRSLTDESWPKGRSVLLTNNLSARDEHGDMSHVWIGFAQKSKDGSFIMLDDCDRRVHGLTHWCPIPLASRSVSPEGSDHA